MNIKVSLFMIILVAVAVFVLRPFNCDSGAGQFDLGVMRAWLKDHHYTQAESVNEPKPDHLPPDIKETALETVTGSGVWIPSETITPDDTVSVELTEVTLPDDSHWVKVVINGDEVKWHKIQRYHRDVRRKWQGIVEVANCNHLLGVGVGYRLFEVASIDVVPAVTVSTQLDWIAPELRLSRNIWSGVSIGAGAGYRFGTDEGLHLSAGLSIEL